MRKMLLRSFLIISLQFSLLFSNPFSFNFPAKKELCNEDFLLIQKALREVDIFPLLNELYLPNKGLSTFEDFSGRCCRGLRFTLIDPSRGLYPTTRLEQIGRGGPYCFVCYASFDGPYFQFIEGTKEALQRVGFNGHFLYYTGGYPNPTGIEIKYAGVPYAFKIFMLRQAEKLGFQQALWIDSSLLPLKDPTPLFNHLKKQGCFFSGSKTYPTKNKYIFPKTRKLLTKLTKTDVLDPATFYVNMAVFGLNFESPKTKKFIEKYYKMVELGSPFLSCFPEEFVITALLGERHFKLWFPHPFGKLFMYSPNRAESLEEKARREGYFFYMRSH